MRVWDAHVIRPSKNGKTPSGRPEVKYYIPHLWNATNCLQPVKEDDYTHLIPEVTFRNAVPCDVDIYELCERICVREGFDNPKTPDDAICMYRFLRREIKLPLNA